MTCTIDVVINMTSEELTSLWSMASLNCLRKSLHDSSHAYSILVREAMLLFVLLLTKNIWANSL